MNEKLKKTFDQVQAEEELKEKTKEFLLRKTRGYTKTKMGNYGRLLPAVACLLFLLLGGHWLYFTPTVEISMDVNPSIELGINRFDRVISVNSYNDDGQELMDLLHIKHMDYAEAINQILENEDIVTLLSNDEIMTICVVGPDGAQSSRILSDIESCTAEKRNTHCYYVHSEEAEAAHEMGLSYGKYRAFLEIQALDPDVTVEEIQGMTMREIRDFMDSLSADKPTDHVEEDETQTDHDREYGYHGAGNGHTHGQENGGKGNKSHTDDE